MLAEKHCESCAGGAVKLNADEVQALQTEVPQWSVAEDSGSINRKFQFKNFAESIDFVNKVGELAEQEQHHPDFVFGWGYAELTLTTHDIGGLHENDFIMAAKIDRLSE
ncbi:MAG: 4a-hydroxytetrahydrobiopterin dehydratase [Rickettsiales bacterium]|nr:4a-hydroxytetrahydrobiopterin dehydratase [Rickettsiales bacterium]